jgi:hypothetical protein
MDVTGPTKDGRGFLQMESVLSPSLLPHNYVDTYAPKNPTLPTFQNATRFGTWELHHVNISTFEPRTRGYY